MISNPRAHVFVQIDADTILPEDLAMMEASYGIARIIQAFPDIRLPPDHVWEEPGTEKHALTLVLASADGCKVTLA